MSAYRLGLPGAHSAGSGTVTVVLARTVCSAPTATAGKLTGIVWPAPLSVPSRGIVRAGPSLRTLTLSATVALCAWGLSGVRVVWIVGSESSLAATSRTLTGPSSPPKLNHVR